MSSDRRLAVVVFAACWVVYHANFRPIAQVDCIPAPYAAWSLVRHASFELQHYKALGKYVGGAVLELDGGRWLSKYPPGSSIAALPFALPFALAREEPLGSSAMRRLGKLVAASCSALAVVLFFFACRSVAPRAAGLATLLFALGSELWAVASQALWAHGPATMWLCLALFLSLRRGDASLRWLGVGLALGMAVATRPPTILFAAASLGALGWQRSIRDALAVGAGLLPPLAFLLLYNQLFFGAAVSGGYGAESTRWTTPLHVGIAGLTIAPSRGLLVYMPALLLIPWGVRALRGRATDLAPGSRAALAAWLLAAAATLVLYARWHLWWGGWCFGPRFLCETLPILCLLFALAYERSGDALRRVARGLVTVSIAVQVLGVFGDDRGAWNARHDGASMFALRDTQIEAHLRHLLREDAHFDR